jgi:hypothetical protein
MPNPVLRELPYTDTKPVGAVDFYYGINATFRYMLQRLGTAAWHRYLGELGRGYFAPVNRRWREAGLLQNEYLVRTTRSCSGQQQTELAVHPERSKSAIRQVVGRGAGFHRPYDPFLSPKKYFALNPPDAAR